MSLLVLFLFWLTVSCCFICIACHLTCLYQPIFFWNTVESFRRRFRCLARDQALRDYIQDFIAYYTHEELEENDEEYSEDTETSTTDSGHVVITVRQNPLYQENSN